MGKRQECLIPGIGMGSSSIKQSAGAGSLPQVWSSHPQGSCQRLLGVLTLAALLPYLEVSHKYPGLPSTWKHSFASPETSQTGGARWQLRDFPAKAPCPDHDVSEDQAVSEAQHQNNKDLRWTEALPYWNYAQVWSFSWHLSKMLLLSPASPS